MNSELLPLCIWLMRAPHCILLPQTCCTAKSDEWRAPRHPHTGRCLLNIKEEYLFDLSDIHFPVFWLHCMYGNTLVTSVSMNRETHFHDFESRVCTTYLIFTLWYTNNFQDCGCVYFVNGETKLILILKNQKRFIIYYNTLHVISIKVLSPPEKAKEKQKPNNRWITTTGNH